MTTPTPRPREGGGAAAVTKWKEVLDRPAGREIRRYLPRMWETTYDWLMRHPRTTNGLGRELKGPLS